MKKILIIACFAALALMNSCVGVSADIVLLADGSGKIVIDYRVSQMMESLGKLDGNARWPAIPVGRTDFERSLARIPGLRISSFSSKEVKNAAGGNDILTRVALEFKDTAALLAFLDNTGNRAFLDHHEGKTRLRLVLLDPAAGITDADLHSFLREIFSGYELYMSFSTPKDASLSILPSSVTAARLAPQGKKVSCAIEMGEIAALNDGLALEVAW